MNAIPYLSCAVLAFGMLLCVIRLRKADASLAELSKLRKQTGLVQPELEAAINLMYNGKIKDARTRLCRLRNTIAQ